MNSQSTIETTASNVFRLLEGQGKKSKLMLAAVASSCQKKPSIMSFDQALLTQASRVVAPISFSRYRKESTETNEQWTEKRREYDALIHKLLERMADMLQKREIQLVDVIATAELHTDWSDTEIKEINTHFFGTHKALLNQLSSAVTWPAFCEKLGQSRLNQRYQEIISASQEGSPLYLSMLDLHTQIQSGVGNQESALEYTRMESAAILEMGRFYTNLVYPGPPAAMFVHIYKLFSEKVRMPIFTRAALMSPHATSMPLPRGAEQGFARTIMITLRKMFFGDSSLATKKELKKFLDHLLQSYCRATAISSPEKPVGGAYPIQEDPTFASSEPPSSSDNGIIILMHIMRDALANDNNKPKDRDAMVKHVQEFLDLYAGVLLGDCAPLATANSAIILPQTSSCAASSLDSAEETSDRSLSSSSSVGSSSASSSAGTPPETGTPPELPFRQGSFFVAFPVAAAPQLFDSRGASNPKMPALG